MHLTVECWFYAAYRLWWYQVCSEVSYFQVAPKNDSVRSTKLDTRLLEIPFLTFLVSYQAPFPLPIVLLASTTSCTCHDLKTFLIGSAFYDFFSKCDHVYRLWVSLWFFCSQVPFRLVQKCFWGRSLPWCVDDKLILWRHKNCRCALWLINFSPAACFDVTFLSICLFYCEIHLRKASMHADKYMPLPFCFPLPESWWIHITNLLLIFSFARRLYHQCTNQCTIIKTILMCACAYVKVRIT